MKLLEMDRLEIDELQSRFDFPPNEATWLRLEAFAKFKELGLPMNKDEIFGKTAVKTIYDMDYASAFKPDSYWQLPETPNYRILFQKGSYSPIHSSLPNGVKVRFEPDPALHKKSKNPFYFLSYALNQGFYSIQVEDNLELEKPIEIIYINEIHAFQNHMHVSLHVGVNSKIQILERVLIQGAGLLNHTLAVHLDKNAKIEYMHEQASQKDAHIISNYLYLQKEDSEAKIYAFEHGSDLGISFWDLHLQGESASIDFVALQTPIKKQHLSTIVELHHEAPNTQSNQLIKQTINDEAKGVVDAKVIVSKNGARTKATQLCNSLILSEKAQVQSFVKPQLEIFIDDLEASHGATVGNLDEEQIYYLMSRGVDYESARKLLIEAFSQEVYEKFPKWAKEFINGG
jgi:Fe-S cluster assembly protein SufD